MKSSINWFRLGLCLIFIGGLFTVEAYNSSSFLVSAHNTQCTSATPASNCGSIDSNAGTWALLTVAFVARLCVGLAVMIVGLRTEDRARRPLTRYNRQHPNTPARSNRLTVWNPSRSHLMWSKLKEPTLTLDFV